MLEVLCVVADSAAQFCSLPRTAGISGLGSSRSYIGGQSPITLITYLPHQRVNGVLLLSLIYGKGGLLLELA